MQIFETAVIVSFLFGIIFVFTAIGYLINENLIKPYLKDKKDYKILSQTYPGHAIYKLPWRRGSKPTKYKEGDLISYINDPDTPYQVHHVFATNIHRGSWFIPRYSISGLERFSWDTVFEEELIEYVPYMEYDPNQQEDLDSDI